MRGLLRVCVTVSAFGLAAGAGLAQQYAQNEDPNDLRCRFIPEDCAYEAADQGEAPEVKGFTLVRDRDARRPVASNSARPSRPSGTTSGRRDRDQIADRGQAGPSGVASVGTRADIRISFNSGSATLTASDRRRLNGFAELLQDGRLASTRFRIEGHTDSVGSRDSNLSLSRRRAQAVADYLVARGIERTRLEVQGFGFDQPLVRPASDARNRRVEAELIAGRDS